MPISTSIDHYEVLQVSHRADLGTIQRVYRHLAKRYHPDNTESGDTELFQQLMESFEVLSNPERRAQYDVGYEAQQKTRWRIFDQQATGFRRIAASGRPSSRCCTPRGATTPIIREWVCTTSSVS